MRTSVETDLSYRFHGRILSIDNRIAARWGLLMAQAQKKGIVLPVIDGLLAATDLQHNLTFVTPDTRGIAAAGVAVFNPWGKLTDEAHHPDGMGHVSEI